MRGMFVTSAELNVCVGVKAESDQPGRVTILYSTRTCCLLSSSCRRMTERMVHCSLGGGVAAPADISECAQPQRVRHSQTRHGRIIRRSTATSAT